MSIHYEDQPDKPPPGWGDSELTKHFEAAHKNRWATFANKRKAFRKLDDIDAAFLKITKDWQNPTSENFLPANMFFRSHSAYRAACDLAFATQVPEVFPTIRVSIEGVVHFNKAIT